MKLALIICFCFGLLIGAYAMSFVVAHHITASQQHERQAEYYKQCYLTEQETTARFRKWQVEQLEMSKEILIQATDLAEQLGDLNVR